MQLEHCERLFPHTLVVDVDAFYDVLLFTIEQLAVDALLCRILEQLLQATVQCQLKLTGILLLLELGVTIAESFDQFVTPRVLPPQLQVVKDALKAAHYIIAVAS